VTTSPLLPLLDHLWQSSVFAAMAGLLNLSMRNNRARIRHGVWLAASVKFLIPFSVMIAAGSHLRWPGAQHAAASDWTAVVVASEPFTRPLNTAPMMAAPLGPSRPAAGFPVVLLGTWVCGFAGIAFSWGVRWRRLARAVRSGSPVDLNLPIPAVTSPTLFEPGVFGVFRPVLLLPMGIFERLSPAQLNSVIVHELYHVRHRDNLAAAFQMLVETVFWFHPLVWWIGKRMIEERERACDEGVLCTGGDPRVYAEAVLNVCRFYLESPVACVSGITGANLKRRIEAIMARQIGSDLHIAKKFGLALAGMAALLAPISIGTIHSRPAMAQSVPPLVAEPSTVFREESRAADTPQRSAPASNTPAAAEEARKLRAAYAKATFHNAAMGAAYTGYGPPDQIEDRNTDAKNPSQLWRYHYLEEYQSNVEFEFVPRASTGARINWPPQATFEGSAEIPSAADVELANALSPEMQGGSEPAAVILARLPGRRAFVQPSIRLSPESQLVNLSVPLDTLSGRIDLIGKVTKIWDAGTSGPAVANVRDRIEATAGVNLTYQTAFLLAPGSYVCRVLVREQASGLTYTESIPFQTK